MAEKRNIDWERIEADYRAGVLSLREIGVPHEITEGAIRKRAKRDGWVRDLSERIKAQADDLVRRQAVRSSVRTSPFTEREIVEANALGVAEVRVSHRNDINRFRALAMRLLAEMEAETGIELIAPGGDQTLDKIQDAYRKVIALPGRIDNIKKLADTLKTLIGLEREAYSIREELPVGEGLTLEQLISTAMESRRKV